MGSVLHGSARTTPRLRAELQASQESTRSLAARYGLNPKTVAKWRERTTTADAPMGRKSRPAYDNRRFLNGMLHVLRVGCPWRDMHERYGKWNSIYVRFRRWAEQGVWDALLETLVELGLTDDWQHMIDSTTVRGHSQAAGAKGGLIRKLLVDHAAALRRKSMPVQTVRDALSVSS